MASRYYGLNRGQNEHDIVEGSSTNSVDIELVVDLDSNSPTKEDVLLALEKLENYILKSTYPAS